MNAFDPEQRPQLNNLDEHYLDECRPLSAPTYDEAGLTRDLLFHEAFNDTTDDDLVANALDEPEARAELIQGLKNVARVLEMYVPLERDRLIIALRLGLLGQEPRTLDSLSQDFPIGPERVRQIEQTFLARLRGTPNILQVIEFGERPQSRHVTPQYRAEDEQIATVAELDPDWWRQQLPVTRRYEVVKPLTELLRILREGGVPTTVVAGKAGYRADTLSSILHEYRPQRFTDDASVTRVVTAIAKSLPDAKKQLSDKQLAATRQVLAVLREFYR